MASTAARPASPRLVHRFTRSGYPVPADPRAGVRIREADVAHAPVCALGDVDEADPPVAGDVDIEPAKLPGGIPGQADSEAAVDRASEALVVRHPRADLAARHAVEVGDWRGSGRGQAELLQPLADG